MRDALERARANEDREFAETRWSDARSSLGTSARAWGGTHSGSRLVDSRALAVAATSGASFGAIARIGGDVGWYYADWLWRVRGALDLLVGGAGMRRSRRDPEALFPGDPLDFWRVEAVERDRLVRLRAEMKVPGRAWLAVRSSRARRSQRDQADGAVRAARPRGSRLLVRAVSDPQPASSRVCCDGSGRRRSVRHSRAP